MKHFEVKGKILRIENNGDIYYDDKFVKNIPYCEYFKQNDDFCFFRDSYGGWIWNFKEFKKIKHEIGICSVDFYEKRMLFLGTDGNIKEIDENEKIIRDLPQTEKVRSLCYDDKGNICCLYWPGKGKARFYSSNDEYKENIQKFRFAHSIQYSSIGKLVHGLVGKAYILNDDKNYIKEIPPGVGSTLIYKSDKFISWNCEGKIILWDTFISETLREDGKILHCSLGKDKLLITKQNGELEIIFLEK